MPDQRSAERDLDRFWDGVARGGAAEVGPGAGLEREQAETVRRFQALTRAPVPGAARARTWERLSARLDAMPRVGRVPDAPGVRAKRAGPESLRPSSSVFGPNGRGGPAEGRLPGPTRSGGRQRWAAVQVASPVVLVATVLWVAVVFWPGDGEGDRIAAPSGPTPEVLAEIAVGGLPEVVGEDQPPGPYLYLCRWYLRPGAAAQDAPDGPTIGQVEAGQLAVRIGAEPARVLGPGATFAVAPGTPYEVRAEGTAQTVYREVRVTGEHWSTFALFDPVDALAEGMGDHSLTGLLPPGPTEVALVRLTLDPGERLEETAEEAHYHALVVEEGALGVDYLRGEEALPSGATPAYEQTIRIGPSGTDQEVKDLDREARRVLGNPGSAPLELLAVRVRPADAASEDEDAAQ